MYIPFLPPLFISDFFKIKKRVLNEFNHIVFNQGREAIWQALIILGLKPGDIVLMPPSLCIEAIGPLLAYGLRIRYYHINEHLLFDINQIASLIDDNVKAVYVVHYYGIPQLESLPQLKTVCKNNSIPLIEDCALSFYTGGKTSSVGYWGDISIFSFWKFIPVPNGGMLLNNSIHKSNIEHINRGKKSISKKLGKQLFKGFMMDFGIKINRLSKYDHYCEDVPIQFEKYSLYKMSSISKYLFERMDLHNICTKRIINYKTLAKELSGVKKIRLLFEHLPASITPYSFPIVVNSPEIIHRKMFSKGICTELSFSKIFRNNSNILNADNSFDYIDKLSKNVISLPIHQRISQKNIIKIANILKGLL